MQSQNEPPLRPHWAVIFTIVSCPIGLVLAITAHYLLYIPWPKSLGWWAVMAYLGTAFPWSSLEWPTKNAAIRGHNAFVIIAICVFVIATITGESYSEFPKWGTYTLIITAAIGYSVMGVCGARNFMKWLRGEINDDDQ